MPQPMFPWLRPPEPHGKSVACLSSGWVEVEAKVMSFGHEALGPWAFVWLIEVEIYKSTSQDLIIGNRIHRIPMAEII